MTQSEVKKVSFNVQKKNYETGDLLENAASEEEVAGK
jgi:hypothetical protein